ncbi:MAG: hypothetical protein IJT18_01885 [Oscillospiraceae bacterium]|nr:hypothetical protein [Oscillospiraceae bacterium]
MKKLICIVLAAALLFTLAACGESATAPVKVDLGKSDRYTQEDLQKAEKLVEDTIKGFTEATIDLKSLTYAGDEKSMAELEYVNSLDRGAFDEVAIFGSLFHTSKDAGGAWEADTDYTWDFYLARSTGGEWTMVTYGY